MHIKVTARAPCYCRTVPVASSVTSAAVHRTDFETNLFSFSDAYWPGVGALEGRQATRLPVLHARVYSPINKINDSPGCQATPVSSGPNGER
jgi:hypothetical protein